jgi:thiamine-phosphate pyrophosphorylase
MEIEGRREFYLGGLCFITDRESCGLTCLEMTLLALKAGVRCVQLRDKNRSRMGYYRMAVNLRKLTRDFGAFYIVNDYADIAASVDADGVHLGQGDLPVREARKILGKDKIIGVSTHSIDEAMVAEDQGADYIGFGPVFRTTTKDAGDPRGTEILQKLREKVMLPVMAIGGIGPDNIDEVFGSGANAVATASAILKGCIEENTKHLMEKIRCA